MSFSSGILSGGREPYQMILARASLPPKKRLSDGTTGFYMRPDRGDDCWQAATATVLQVPFDDVPDLRLNARAACGESPEQEDARYKAAQRMAELIEEREALMARADDDPDAAIKLREVESEMRAAEEVVRAID